MTPASPRSSQIRTNERPSQGSSDWGEDGMFYFAPSSETGHICAGQNWSDVMALLLNPSRRIVRLYTSHGQIVYVALSDYIRHTVRLYTSHSQIVYVTQSDCIRHTVRLYTSHSQIVYVTQSDCIRRIVRL